MIAAKNATSHSPQPQRSETFDGGSWQRSELERLIDIYMHGKTKSKGGFIVRGSGNNPVGNNRQQKGSSKPHHVRNIAKVE